MSFQPIVPLSGYAGWRFLSQTLPVQQETYAKSAPVARATDYFRENIGKVQTAADLVADRQLLSVALGAFGLDDDIDNRFYIRSILEQGTLDPAALANRLTDKRYARLADAFGFADRIVPRTILRSFADEITARYAEAQFARAVGNSDNNMRLALNVADGLGEILAENRTNTGRWFSVMGNPPLRNVFETALGLPSGIGSIDVDRQREIFEERAESVLGSGDLADLADPEAQEKLIRLFLIRAEANAFAASTGASAALTLLQSIPSPRALA